MAVVSFLGAGKVFKYCLRARQPATPPTQGAGEGSGDPLSKI